MHGASPCGASHSFSSPWAICVASGSTGRRKHRDQAMRKKIEILAKLARNATLSCVLLLSAAPAIAQTVAVKAYEGSVKLDTKNPAEQKRKEMAEFVAGNMLFVLLHEMAHVHVSEMGLPVLGREEDAADSYATLAMLRMGSEFSYNV